VSSGAACSCVRASPRRPRRTTRTTTQPIALMIKAGECESRIGDVDVVVFASVERNKSTIKIQFASIMRSRL